MKNHYMTNRYTVVSKCFYLLFVISGVLYACSKSDSGGTTPNVCAGVTITVTGTITDTDAGASTGSIAAASSGGTGSVTFNIDGGAFQSSGTFNGLAKGVHTIVAKDSRGCTGSGSFTVNEKNACAGVNITLTATSTDSDPCAPSGVVTASAAGSTNFTYSIDAGAFQASNIFNNISAGNHTVNVKDGAGCGKSTPITINEKAAGTLFLAARSVIQTNCAVTGCHTGPAPTGGINFSVDCNIVLNKDRVKARAIDGNPSFMPPTGALPQTDRDKITAWINAGGRFTD